jgi:hypothetical protein
MLCVSDCPGAERKGDLETEHVIDANCQARRDFTDRNQSRESTIGGKTIMEIAEIWPQRKRL